MNSSVIMQQLKPYAGNKQILVVDQSTSDIIAAITSAHHEYLGEYAKFAEKFRGRTDRETAKNIFNFLKKNVVYRIESGNAQTVKSPAALLAQGYGDCKHYSKFAAGILHNLGIPFAYRFASYKYFDRQPGHVFVVIHPGTKKEIWIDPVLPKLDQRKPYFHKIDKKMALYKISGIGQTRKEQRQERRAARKAAGKTLGQKLKKGVRLVAKVYASPARNAFLLLVRINFANLAVKLNNAWIKAPSKVRNFWEGIGGNVDALKKAWETGKGKKRIFGNDEIGAAPAAAAAAASPIIVKVITLLKDIGIEPGELVQIGKDALNTKVKELVSNTLVKETEQEAENIEIAERFNQDLQPQAESKPAGKNMLPIIIGGAVVAVLLMRKK